jgi:uncharacterized protein YgiM (DUF1202 family)
MDFKDMLGRNERLILIGIVSVFFLWAMSKCLRGSGGAAASETRAKNKNASANSTVYVSTDSVYIRSGPARGDSVITVVYRGEQLFYSGQRSGKSVKIRLDGREYDEPWLRIETQSRKAGWVYGGAVRVYK